MRKSDKTKKKIDKKKLCTRILAAVLAVLMIMAVLGTLLYYIIN